MTALAMRDDRTAVALTDSRDQSIARLADWAQAADAAYKVADKLCDTQFVPVAYRKKPYEATAAILAGAEVGLSPMASLRAFDNIQGTPAPKAITLRAIVQAQGHEVRIEESSDTRAVVAVRRKGSDEWQRSVWTIDRARKMGLTNKDQWKNQPAAMLIARATSEGCRWIAADAIMGMPYSVEELRDGDGVEEQPQRLLTVADIIDPAEAPVSGPPAGDGFEPMDGARQRRMFALFKDCGFGDKDAQLAFIAELLGRAIQSRSELSATDGERLIEALEQTRRDQQQAEPDDADIALPMDAE